METSMSTAFFESQFTSINEIIRRNPRERLLEKPGLWTSRHLELLGCQFVDRGQTKMVSEASAPRHPSLAPSNTEPNQITPSPLLLDRGMSYAERLQHPRNPRWFYIAVLLQRIFQMVK